MNLSDLNNENSKIKLKYWSEQLNKRSNEFNPYNSYELPNPYDLHRLFNSNNSYRLINPYDLYTDLTIQTIHLPTPIKSNQWWEPLTMTVATSGLSVAMDANGNDGGAARRRKRRRKKEAGKVY